MKAAAQIVAAALIAAATYGVLVRIAEAKVDAAVGGKAFPLDDHRVPEREAFERIRARLAEIGERRFGDRLEALRATGGFWVAPSLGPDRWAVFAESLRLVRRVYVRQKALLDPRGHLYPSPSPVPEAHQRAFAWISLAGALRHELAHHEGMIEEQEAYDAEIAWYETVRASPWFAGLRGEDLRMFDWALESAVLTARSASSRSGATGGGAR